MIVVDTSALMAILLNEEEADRCAAALEQAEELLISAGTLAEALIVSASRGLRPELEELVAGLPVHIQPETQRSSLAVADAYAQWGKGVHPAKLNFGDCFAYALARSRRAPLLFVGNDFSQTDIEAA
nr:type II toxin-antitoxin system VapC family toxin [Oceanococcus sp. HetDA_MAG_MS8]